MILVYGTVCLDRINHVPRLPVQGGYVEISARAESIGGEAANSAIALVRLGESPVLVGNSIGTGAMAFWLESQVAEMGVSSFHAPTLEHEAPVCEIYVTPDGERTMFGYGFAAMVDRSDPTLCLPAGNHITAVDPNHGLTSRERVRLAKHAGHVIYALDFNGADEPLGRGDLWQSSTDQVGVPQDQGANEAWITEWTARHGVTSILTDGPRGLHVMTPGRAPEYLPAFPSPLVRDMTGAGDAFRGGVLYGIAAGWSLARSVMLGAAVGSLNCRGIGGVEGLPSLTEANQLIADHPEIANRYLRLE